MRVEHEGCHQQRVDPDTPIEDTVGALAELVAEGKVLHELSAGQIARLDDLTPAAGERHDETNMSVIDG